MMCHLCAEPAPDRPCSICKLPTCERCGDLHRCGRGRYHVSVSGKMHARVRAAAAKRGVSAAQLVEQVVLAALDGDHLTRHMKLRQPGRKPEAWRSRCCGCGHPKHVHGPFVDTREPRPCLVAGCACGSLAIRMPGR